MKRLVLLIAALTAGAAAAEIPRAARLLRAGDASHPAQPGQRLLVQPVPGDAQRDLEDVPFDPHARRLVMKEVLVGAGMVLAADLAALTFGAGLGGLALLVFDDRVIALAVGLVSSALLDLAAAPLAAALGAFWMAPKEGTNGLLGAMLGAAVGQLASVALGAALYAGLGALVLWGTPTAATIAAGLALYGGLALLHFGLISAGASLGIHWTAPPREPAPSLPLSHLLPTTPHQVYQQALLRPPPAVQLRF